jgi:hypothetical protein
MKMIERLKKVLPLLLLGTLSVLFAEILAGSSQIWYINPFAIALLFSVYLGQILFFLWIAGHFQKTSLSALYFFGVIFGLYESWITKVLWAGYQASTGPGMGTFMGVGIAEFPILVFFWHPLLAFIAPILAFEVLSGRTIITHEKILQRSKKKDILLVIFIVLCCTFLASNNQFDMISSNLSLLGTLSIAMVLFFICKKSSILDSMLNKKQFIFLSVFIALLYILSFVFITPEKIPNTIIPYLTILAFYAVGIFLIAKAPKTPLTIVEIKGGYTTKNLVWLAIITIVAVNIWCVIPKITSLVLVISYILFMVLGIILFLFSAYSVLIVAHKRDSTLGVNRDVK